MAKLYELKIIATGEVRDADGNLLNQEPVEATAVVTEEQMAEILRQQQEEQS